MYNYKLIDKINIYPDKSVVIKYLSGYRKTLYNKPLYFFIKNKQLDGKATKYNLEFINDYLKEIKCYNNNKNKMTFNKFIRILENNNNGFYNYLNLKHKDKKGIVYFLSNSIKRDLKNKLEKNFKNIMFLKTSSEYAPEIEKPAMILF